MIEFNISEKGFRNPDKKLCGLLIECKDPDFYRKFFKFE